MNFFQRIQQKSETQRRAMMLVSMVVLSAGIIYVWFQSLDLGAIAQNPVQQVSQEAQGKNELSPLRSLWMNVQIAGDGVSRAGAGLKFITEQLRGKFPGGWQDTDVTKATNASDETNVAKVANETNDALKQNQPILFGQENKKSFLKTTKEVVMYNIKVLESFFGK